MPGNATWGSLLGNATLSDLCAASATPQARPDVASWNARWLLRTNTAKAAAKRNVILQALGQKAIVVLQETHWTPQAEAMWETLFPGSKIFSTPARPGPKGGPQGGVAILVPHPFIAVPHKTLADGCTIEVTVQHSGPSGDHTVVRGVYLPPRLAH